jgi:hypothetical protein
VRLPVDVGDKFPDQRGPPIDESVSSVGIPFSELRREWERFAVKRRVPLPKDLKWREIAFRVQGALTTEESPVVRRSRWAQLPVRGDSRDNLPREIRFASVDDHNR